MASEEKMRELLRRIKALEETVEKLHDMVVAMSKASRRSALLEVDDLERLAGIEPRTAALRKQHVA